MQEFFWLPVNHFGCFFSPGTKPVGDQDSTQPNAENVFPVLSQ